MKQKLAMLGLWCFTLMIVGSVRTPAQQRRTDVQQENGAQQQGTPSVQQRSKPASLNSLAQRAKATGEQEISFPTDGIVDYGMARTADEALSHYSLIVAVLEKQQSYLQEPDDITTWYRFRIIETLHQPPKDSCADCSVVPDPPADLTRAQDDELLIPRSGGTIVLDGVKVTIYDPKFPNLSLSHKYLLFVYPDPTIRVQFFTMGPMGIYAIRDDDGIEPLFKVRYALDEDIRARLGNTLTGLRTGLKAGAIR